jgi:hypothetical protein
MNRGMAIPLIYIYRRIIILEVINFFFCQNPPTLSMTLPVGIPNFHMDSREHFFVCIMSVDFHVVGGTNRSEYSPLVIFLIFNIKIHHLNI